MNCVELFVHQAKSHPQRMAIWVPDQRPVTFGELLEMGARAQRLCRRYGVRAGDHVLLLDDLGPRLYALVSALLAMGVCVVLVEPWMPVDKINHVINTVQPKIFLSHRLGQLWGLRVSGVRAIPNWVHVGRLSSEQTGPFEIESVEENTRGILTFTSGTTGHPKGVLRNQGYLVHQHRILTQALHLNQMSGPDLCIFANFALANLASGRGSILVPPKWKSSHLRQIQNLGGDLRPESLTTGPAFLLRLMEAETLPALKSIHVGGALTDCGIFERAFELLPETEFMHIYGSSEAEPVALADAREAVKQSRARGYFQTLFLGSPIADIQARFETDGLWVTGPHVCPQYVGNDEENLRHKRRDEDGRVWHFMGDRIQVDGAGWWYAGRSNQSLSSFQLEQRLYSELQTSKAFLQEDQGRLLVCAENAKTRGGDIRKAVPNIHEIYDVRIQRDRRHRARIDRAASFKTRKLWPHG